ncbi:hypothetical protein PROFUN_03755 [Planoprotostelium fungivorum]|uniref:Uncharacterized protein n=1 Tax=Planoprotostelium fungivorum TaxID=1890364 RepID=A0A2P6NDR3_9EUKA|nr:hypothetical protein PROFUN_03755 [Planoprotostelium fungivorum]
MRVRPSSGYSRQRSNTRAMADSGRSREELVAAGKKIMEEKRRAKAATPTATKQETPAPTEIKSQPSEDVKKTNISAKGSDETDSKNGTNGNSTQKTAVKATRETVKSIPKPTPSKLSNPSLIKAPTTPIRTTDKSQEINTPEKQRAKEREEEARMRLEALEARRQKREGRTVDTSTTSAPAPLQYEEPEKSKDKSPVAAAEKSPALRNSPKIPQVSTSTTDETEESKIAAKSVESPVQTKIASPTLPIEPASNSSSDNGETIESLREQLEQQKKVISRLEGKLELIRQKEEQEEELMEEMVNIEAMQNIRDLRAQNEALKLEIQTLRSLTKNEPVVEIESTTTGLDGTPVSAEEKGEYEQKMNQQWATIENLSKQKTQLMQQLKSAGEKVAVLLQENQELSVRLHQVLHPEMFQPKVLPLLEVRSQHNEGNNTRSSPVVTV